MALTTRTGVSGRIRLDLFEDLGATATRHHRVEQHQVRPLVVLERFESLDRVGAVTGFDHFVTGHLQPSPEQQPDRSRIFRDHDQAHAGPGDIRVYVLARSSGSQTSKRLPSPSLDWTEISPR